MSKASRLTKCCRRSTAWAGQIRPPVQRRTASPSSRTAWLSQTGQWSGKTKGLLPRGRFVRHHRDHLRDHVAGALDDDGVAVADVLARDLVLVVQGGAADDDAADGDRLQLGHRRQRAGAADLDR